MSYWANNIITLDAESTGLNLVHDKIHQLSLKYKNKELNLFIHPPPDFFDVLEERKKTGIHILPDRYNTPYTLPDVPRLTFDEAADRIIFFLEEIIAEIRSKGVSFNLKNFGDRFIPLGQNPTFDMSMMRMVPQFNLIIEKYFLFKPLDLFSVAYFSLLLGIIPSGNKLGLKHIFLGLFSNDPPKEFHDSMEDVQATYAGWNELIKIFQSKLYPQITLEDYVRERKAELETLQKLLEKTPE